MGDEEGVKLGGHEYEEGKGVIEREEVDNQERCDAIK
jgi:hypothetical protein